MAYRMIGGFQFIDPATGLEDGEAWEPRIFVEALHRCVLAVARTRCEGTWAAYVFPVPGNRHSEEWKLWEDEGAKMQEDVARALFPRLNEVPYAR